MNNRLAMIVPLFLGFLWCGDSQLFAQQLFQGLPAPNVELPTAIGAQQTLSSNATGPEGLVRLLLLTHLPRTYENSKKWGLTKPRWNGIDVSFDGLNVKTKRKWKEVNHGTWTRYQAWLIEPEKELVIYFRELRPSGTHRVAFELIIDAHLGTSGRLAEWNRGVQLYSLSADADAKVRLTMTCDVGWKMDASHFPPDLVLDPKVSNARLNLFEFQLHHLSDLHGSLARSLGDSLRDDLEREVNERRDKLVEKINRAINKNRDKLRLSPHDWVANGWSKLIPGVNDDEKPLTSPAPSSSPRQ